jgi:type IV secretory pathway VirB4 component
MYSRHVGTENLDARNDLHRRRWRGYATPQSLKLKYANRHGLIAGATGTGKTVTLQIMAEEFSAAGVPVFLSDVKSDLAGLSKSGSADFKLHDAFTSRAQKIGF